MHNPITEEIRAVRRTLAAQFDNDLDRIVDDIQRRQKESSRKFVRLPKRSPRTDHASSNVVSPKN